MRSEKENKGSVARADGEHGLGRRAFLKCAGVASACLGRVAFPSAHGRKVT